jgi:hypothetical protein
LRWKVADSMSAVDQVVLMSREPNKDILVQFLTALLAMGGPQ